MRKARSGAIGLSFPKGNGQLEYFSTREPRLGIDEALPARPFWYDFGGGRKSF